MPLAQAEAPAITLEDVNRFLNESAKLGEGSKANPVAVIPFNHIDGPQEEDLFYAFVPFQYEARNYVKYQVVYISCTCRSADVNYWTTAYVDLTLPDSGKLDDAQIRTLSFEKDGTGHYNAAVWGDSSPIPPGQTYELINEQYVPYWVGKTWAQIKDMSTTEDIDLKDYQAGEGRGEFTIDAWTGATVSTNNILRMLQAIMRHHGTNAHFAGDESLKVEAVAPAAEAAAPVAQEAAPAVAGQALLPLPAPVDTSKTYKPDKDAKEEVPCTEGSFGPTCSAINASNLKDYMNRPDILYIDLRDFGDYMKKHFRNFETIPFFALIFNAEAHTNADLPQLYGGSPTEPVPVYKESDELLEVLFPKDKTLFIMCQAGGRVGMLMNILKARGWDMSKIYNVGGMAQYTGAEYKDMITDTPEFLLADQGNYKIEGLTRIAP
jgi:rhodanese-related sulfurtransferase